MKCKCGSRMEEKEKDMAYKMFDETIEIKNIEYWKCGACGEEDFGENEKEITRILRIAYLEKNKVIDFKKEKISKE